MPPKVRFTGSSSSFRSAETSAFKYFMFEDVPAVDLSEVALDDTVSETTDEVSRVILPKYPGKQ